MMARIWLEDHQKTDQSGFGPWPQLAQAILATAEFQYVD